MRLMLIALAAAAAVLITTPASFAQRGLLKGGLVKYRYKTDEQRGVTIGGGLPVRPSGKPQAVKKRGKPS